MRIDDSRPEPFEKGACSIWLDPHIQREMLCAHLDPDSDAASRRPEAISAVCDWLSQQLAPNSRILDLGCGPGLYAAQLVARGHRITGVDLNGHAIDHAQQECPDVTFFQGDYIRDFPCGEFDAVILIYCDFCTHSDSERASLLHDCFNALAPGGKLIFDFFPAQATVQPESKTWEYCAHGGFWAPDEYLLLSQRFHYPERALRAEQYHLICGNDIRCFIVWERAFSCSEIADMLKASGFDEVVFTEVLLPHNTFTKRREVFSVATKGADSHDGQTE